MANGLLTRRFSLKLTTMVDCRFNASSLRRWLLFGLLSFSLYLTGTSTYLFAATTNYSNAQSVTVDFAEETENLGLREIFAADGGSLPAIIHGQRCHLLDLEERSVRYFYFAIDPSFKWSGAPETNRISVRVEVEYFDNIPGSFDLQYDGYDPRGLEHGAYTTARNSERHSGIQKWRAARFELKNARFLNSQNGGADFRLRVYTNKLYVRQVTVFRQ